MNVIHLFGPPPAVDGAPDVQQRDWTCYPHWPVVDQVSRTVSCSRCKKQLDAIDVLLEVARKHDDWNRLSGESRTMRAAVESLKAEEKRVKARTKAASRKDAQAAVEAERELDAQRRQQTADAANEIRDLATRIMRLSRTADRKEFDGEGYWRQRALSAERKLRGKSEEAAE